MADDTIEIVVVEYNALGNLCRVSGGSELAKKAIRRAALFRGWDSSHIGEREAETLKREAGWVLEDLKKAS